MKTLIVFIAILVSVGVSCSYESLPSVCVDPMGSQDVRVSSNYVNYEYCDCTLCFFEQATEVINGTSHSHNNGCFQFYKPPLSPAFIFSKSFCSSCKSGELIDIGEVKCLSGILSKPTTGYSTSVIPELHHGYVIRFSDTGTYARFFVDSWVIEQDVVTGMNIVRQYPFE